MNALRIISLPIVCLTLSACNQYLERKDTLTFSAGDAVASNSAVQIPDPWPRYSRDTNIAFDGEKIRRAVKRYREGELAPQNNTSIIVNAPGSITPSAPGPVSSPAQGY